METQRGELAPGRAASLGGSLQNPGLLTPSPGLSLTAHIAPGSEESPVLGSYPAGRADAIAG